MAAMPAQQQQPQPQEDSGRVRQQLLAFLSPDETAHQFFTRVRLEHARTGLRWIDERLTLRPGVVVEVAGPTASGKTELLVQAAVHSLLLPLIAPERANQVVYLDLDGKFDPVRLVQVLDLRLGNAVSSGQTAGTALGAAAAVSRDAYNAALDACLSRFHLIKAHSSYELLLGLARLDGLLTRLGPSPGCSVLLLDNVGAFYWQDKAYKAWVPHTGHAPQLSAAELALLAPPLTLHRVHEALAAHLRELSRRHRFAVVATKYVTHVAASLDPDLGGTKLVPKEYLPLAWQGLVTHRICTAPASLLGPHLAGAAGGGGLQHNGLQQRQLQQSAAAGEPASAAAFLLQWTAPAVGPLAAAHVTDRALDITTVTF